jgi:hypothetical protein
MANEKSTELKYASEMREFLSIMEWGDTKVDSNVEGQQVVIATGVDIDGQSGRVIIEANSDTDIFDFYIYFTSIKCKPNKNEQMQWLMNELNKRWLFGRFQCFKTDDAFLIRWHHRIDFEGSSPTGVTVRNNFKPGWDATEFFSGVIAAVALTNQSAKDAIAEHDQEQSARNEAREQAQPDDEDESGPTEL